MLCLSCSSPQLYSHQVEDSKRWSIVKRIKSVVGQVLPIPRQIQQFWFSLLHFRKRQSAKCNFRFHRFTGAIINVIQVLLHILVKPLSKRLFHQLMYYVSWTWLARELLFLSHLSTRLLHRLLINGNVLQTFRVCVYRRLLVKRGADYLL